MQGGQKRPPHTSLVRYGYWFGAFLLRFGQRCSYVVEGGNVLVDIGFGVLNRDGPLLVPPIGLS